MFHSILDQRDSSLPKRMSIILDQEERPIAKIKVVGVGGGGCNAVDSMVRRGLTGVEFIALNTDLQTLQECAAQTKIQIGKNLTRGLGAGSDILIGESAIREDEEKIREALLGADMIFITSCFGGGTGTGAAPVLAEIAKGTQALVVSIITKPFRVEGKQRNAVAEAGIEKIRDKVDSLIVLKNDILLGLYGGDVPLFEMFDKPNEVLYQSTKGITEMITKKGIINVDFADVRAAMKLSGDALIGTGRANGERRAERAAEEAISCPMLEGIDIRGSKNVLVNITASSSFTSKEYSAVTEKVSQAVGSEANIKYGIVNDEKQEDFVSVTVIATGYKTNFRHISSIELTQATKPIIENPGNTKVFTINNVPPPEINIKPYKPEDLDYFDVPTHERMKSSDFGTPQDNKKESENNSFSKNFQDATKKEDRSEISRLLKKLLD